MYYNDVFLYRQCALDKKLFFRYNNHICNGYKRVVSPSLGISIKTQMYYVYVLKSKKDGSIYIGRTNNLKRRFEEHNTRKNTSAKHKAPFEVVYYEAYKSKLDAERREQSLKRFSGASIHLKKRIVNSLTDSK